MALLPLELIVLLETDPEFRRAMKVWAAAHHNPSLTPVKLMREYVSRNDDKKHIFHDAVTAASREHKFLEFMAELEEYFANDPPFDFTPYLSGGKHARRRH